MLIITLQISNFMRNRNKVACLKGRTWLFNEVKHLVNWAWKRTFWENVIWSIPKIETLELLKSFFTSNFERSCKLDVKTTKNLPRQKLKDQGILLEEKNKISEISKFSIFSYTQNWKLRNLGKFFFTSDFDSICNFFRIYIFCKQSEALFFFVTFNVKSHLSWKIH